MAKYTTEEKVENYILYDIDSSFSTQIDEWIEGVSKYIENYTGRVFIADTDASARSYDGNGRRDLIIDDCIEVTKVEWGTNQWGDSYVEISDTGTDRYYTLPTNNQARDVPIRKLGLRNRLWTPGHANHRITAKWGWSENVPSDIEFVATVFTAGIINAKREGGKGDVTSEKIGEYAITYGEKEVKDLEMAQKLLDKYIKYEL